MKTLKLGIVAASAAAALIVGLGAQAQPAPRGPTLLALLQAAGVPLAPADR